MKLRLLYGLACAAAMFYAFRWLWELANRW